jgi:hypothetical protein
MDVSAAPTPGLPHPCTADQASTSAEPKPGADCDDSTAAAAPGLLEVFDGLDNNCDEQVDPGQGLDGCVDYYLDDDQDGWRIGAPKCLRAPTALESATVPGDCNDKVALRRTARWRRLGGLQGLVRRR